MYGALISLCNRFPSTLVAAALTLATPFLAPTQSNAQGPTTPSGKALAFTIVSIKRHGNTPGGGVEGCYADGCHFVDRPLLGLIMVAYNLSQKPILGNPLPGDSDLFDLDAKIDPVDLPATPLTSRQLADMLQPVLADRFKLRVHQETRTTAVYNMVLAKGGLKMKESAPPASSPPRPLAHFPDAVSPSPWGTACAFCTIAP